MNILLTNDDGIRADGINALAKALSEVADVYVVAPDGQRSACGHSITLKKPLYIMKTDFPYGVEAYQSDGTPSDCVSLGIKLLEERGIKIDMVFSGINHGSNLGTDTLYSGTVAAAIEGTMARKPSAAVSVDSLHPKHFETVCELAVQVIEKGFDKMDPMTVLNINAPDIPREEIRGLKFTTLGMREYDDWLHPFDDIEDTDAEGKVKEKTAYHVMMEGGDRVESDDENAGTENQYYDEVFNDAKYYIYGGTPKYYKNLSTDIDVGAIQENYASITPLRYDMTDYGVAGEIEEWDVFEL